MKVPSTKVSRGISKYTHYMSSPNAKLSYHCIKLPEKLVFSVSCSLSAGLVPVTNKTLIHSL
ncbi:BgTH12-01732 [Blumeria graminis f. sp. triticale]|uniref:BgTH12-01732 n=1 Tax=Blumeria graminis f. sp. triticale TaxID=1689686 RepID=A0A9W4D538_BLUGR|nr:BgTH12-01732 [Blumeria graminis f. sp. triticale]